MDALSAAILVGGSSRRFGGKAKPLVVVGGERVIDRQVRCLRDRCEAIAVVSAREEGDLGLDDDIELLLDVPDGAGPLAGIAAALEWSPTEWLFVVAGDMPLLAPDWIDACVARAGDEVDLIAARVDGRAQPLASLYRRRCFNAMAKRLSLGQLSPTALFFDTSGELRPVVFDASDADATMLRGFNTVEELEEIRRLLSRE